MDYVVYGMIALNVLACTILFLRQRKESKNSPIIVPAPRYIWTR